MILEAEYGMQELQAYMQLLVWNIFMKYNCQEESKYCSFIPIISNFR